MNAKRLLRYSSLILLFSLTVSPVLAQHHQSPAEQLIGQIVQDVIVRTSEAARAEVQRHTGIDPFERGYDQHRKYSPGPANASKETRTELQQLADEHNRKMVKLQEELDQKLNKAREEFEREAAREDKTEKIQEKRAKLQEKTDDAYAKFDEKVNEENQRFDQKRAKILSKTS